MNTLYITKKGRKLVIEHIMEILPTGIVMTSGHFILLTREEVEDIERLFERE